MENIQRSTFNTQRRTGVGREFTWMLSIECLAEAKQSEAWWALSVRSFPMV
jgi:hypothetical protein